MRNRLQVQSEALGSEVRCWSCKAPAMQLYLFANGDVGPCCRNSAPYGNITSERLGVIWRSVQRRQLATVTSGPSFGLGCEVCATEDEVEGRQGSLASTFDHWAQHLGAEVSGSWPVRMEFELTNACNLQCVQCSGDLSSAIRSHREHRPPMRRSYGEQFFSDLREFIPHLRHASFVGGEPFLGRENYRVWELIERYAPELECAITTNATVWNGRVERVLESLDVHPIVSLDGITASVYESIRQGASFESVIENLERFNGYAVRNGRTLNINFCLMPTNIHQFPDVLRFAEDRGAFVNAQVVRSPVDHSLAHMDAQDLRTIADHLQREDAEMRRDLQLNLRTWNEELARIESWLRGVEREGITRWTRDSPRVLMFPRAGRGPTDTSAEHSYLQDATGAATVHSLDVGPDERVIRCSDELARLLGTERSELVGRSLVALQQAVVAYDVVESSADRYEASFELPSGAGRLVMVPVRDRNGWADRVLALFAMAERPTM